MPCHCGGSSAKIGEKCVFSDIYCYFCTLLVQLGVMGQVLTLSQLNGLVADAVAFGVPGEYIVCAELSGVRESHGHCFMELVENSPDMRTPVAKASAKCWKSTWQVLSPAFVRVTGEHLRAGMKVMLTVRADFHVAYGFSWIVLDISAEYSLGEMSRRRHEIVDQLKREGVFHLQHELRLPRFCQRIAVVSAETAAGYGDFVAQLTGNGYGLAFGTALFAAVMQGEGVESAVVDALGRIYARADEFDCVVIIRGGGATADLAGFDTLALAEHIANFPLPIITGIGHERDESVADMVASIRTKTPTAAAAFLIDHLHATSELVENAARSLRQYAASRLETEQARIANMATASRLLASRLLDSWRNGLGMMVSRLPAMASMALRNEFHRMDMLSARVAALDPQLMLKRGYAIVSKDGHAVRDAANLSGGDMIDVRLGRGSFTATVADTLIGRGRANKKQQRNGKTTV